MLKFAIIPFILFALTIATPSFAADWCVRNAHGYCARGFTWYDDAPAKQKEPAISKKNLMEQPLQQKSAPNLKIFQRNFAELKARAVLHPKSKKDLQAFLKAEAIAVQLAHDFQLTYAQVVAEKPALFGQNLPDGREAHDDALSQKQWTRRLIQISHFLGQKGNKLFFIYDSNCPHCQKMAPKMAAFAKSMRINLIALTLNGKILPSLPNTVNAPNKARVLAQRLNIRGVPAVVLMKHKKAYIVGLGEMSEFELVRRIENFIGAKQPTGENHV